MIDSDARGGTCTPQACAPAPHRPTGSDAGRPPAFAGRGCLVRSGRTGEDPQECSLAARRMVRRGGEAPEVKSKLALQELYSVGLCGAEFAAHLRKQHADFGRIIREAHIKAE